MPRYYVQHNGKWNLFSTIVDDFLFERFVSFEKLKRYVIEEGRSRKIAELETLLTDDPVLNVMTYREAVVTRTIREAGEQWEGESHEFDTCINELYRKWDESGAPPEAFVQAVRGWLEKSRQGAHDPHHDSTC